MACLGLHATTGHEGLHARLRTLHDTSSWSRSLHVKATLTVYEGNVNNLFSNDATELSLAICCCWWGVQVAQVREVEVRAARGEGAQEARQVAEQQRVQLQHERQERMHQLQDQAQQV